MSMAALPLAKVVSGGQTGVDRAALDAAQEVGLTVGGWCPLGRRAEDGPIDTAYPLTETPDPGYEQRTKWNVREADATLILNWGSLEGGTALTLDFLATAERPYLLIQLDEDPDPERVRQWLREGGFEILNVAGPRASKAPQVYAAARELLVEVFAEGGSRE